MANVTIVVQSGGSADPGDTITWQNTDTGRVKVTGLAGVCSQAEFHVPASANGKSGEHGGSVLPNAAAGDHVYTITPDAKATTAILKVNSSRPK
jgi:plastocyanin